MVIKTNRENTFSALLVCILSSQAPIRIAMPADTKDPTKVILYK